jgi:hypothetical protein
LQREQVEAIEASLRQIAGIQSARIRADNGEIAEVFVVAAPTRRAKGVVRDVVTTLYARHGTALSHEKVSVATTGSSAEGGPEEDAPSVRRLLFRSVNLYREGNRNEGQVELQDGDRVLTGVASGPAVRHSQERLVAQAAMQAVGRTFGGGVVLDLAGLQRSRVGSRTAVLAHLILLRGRMQTHLTGSALVGTDALEATVFAVLDALNRVLPTLSGEDTIEYEVEDLPPESTS